ncbi:MAG: glycosyltransferase family 4 protein [Chloroflexia bacterium]|nr:glycosyltransferase family 4 protein [Chloroflexia bacterium]
MNILIFNWRDLAHPWAGGAEVFIHQVASRWVERGHRVHWFCGRYPGQPAHETVDGLEISRRGGIYTVYPWAVLYYLRRLRGRYDVILDSANGIPFFSPLFSSVPTVLLVHHVHREVFFRELPRHLAHVANGLEGKAMPLVYRKRPCITVSESSRQALVRLGLPAENITVIHNGLDHDRYGPGPKCERPLLLYLGRLRHYKSIDVALRALPDILRVVPELEFGIVGSGPAESSLRALTRELGIAARVRFYGHVAEADKIRLLQQAHLVVNPSMKEGWGLTVIEANACGTPVVAADVPGLRNSVRHGETGLLVPYDDPGALARTVSELLLDTHRREQLTRNALAWAAGFDWSASAQQCLDLFSRCLAERRSKSWSILPWSR